MVSKDEITNVGDAESQHVTAFAVLRSTLPSSVVLGKLVNALLLLLDIGARSFENESNGNHLVRIEAKRPGNEPSFSFALQFLRALGGRLQGLAELKLQIVHQPHARRQLFL